MQKLPAVIAIVVAIGLMAGGCVQRRLTIRSNPPGARVYVGDQEIGTTPVSTDFVYYGTRRIRLAKDGYETLVVNQPIPTPWYQIPPLDFVSENLVPGEIRDERVINYQLVPLQQVPTDQLLSRAEQLRASSGAQQVNVVAPQVTPPPTQPGILPEPGGATPAPAGQSLPVFAPPPAAGAPATSPSGPPLYNPPVYLPPG